MTTTPALQSLIDAFAMLPGIGRKSATRLAFFIIKQDASKAQTLARAIIEAKRKIRFCERCQNLCEHSPCQHCTRDVEAPDILCAVETPQDLLAIEATHEYQGRYHVLHGVISPLDGVGPKDLKIRELLERVKDGEFSELIVATNPSVEGEATAIYLRNLLSPLGIKVTRIASGLPMGAQLEYADKATLGRSLNERRAL